MKKILLTLLFFAFVLSFAGCSDEHVHSFSTEWASNKFYHWHTCTNGCSELLNKEQHTWDEGFITKNPTDQENGEKTYTCTECSFARVEIVEHEHEFSDEYTYDEVFHWFEATCGHDDETKYKELHNYEFEQNTPATCTEAETLLGVCVCGDTTVKVGEPAKGHRVLNYVSDNNALCGVDGTKTGECDDCHEMITVTDEGSMLEHLWVEKTTEPTYLSTGERYRECSREECGLKETIEVLPKLIAVSEINISGNKFMTINKDQTLEPTLWPVDVSDKTLTWVSSNPSIAKVDENGHVEALKTGKATITATSHNGINKEFEILVIETDVDAEIDSFYNGVEVYSGKRDVITHDSYIKLGTDGIYVYQVITDNKGLTGSSHTELYFTLGDTSVLDNSLAVHIYSLTSSIKTYTYNSTTENNKLSGNVDNTLAEKYCNYSVKIISESSNSATYSCELFVDYSYFGLTEAPEYIKTQIKVIAGGGNPLTNQTTGSLAIKDISNYELYGPNGHLVEKELEIDGEKDAKYPSTPMTVSRTEISQDVYVYLGEKGVYVYQLVTDTTAITPLKTASELYLAVGNKLTNANSFGIYCYFDSTTENPFRTYKYNETSGAFGRNFAGAYPDYCGLKVLETGNGYTKYAYEMFIEYSLLGLDSAPESVKIFAVARINTGGAIANGNVTKDLPITDITKYQEFNNNGLVTVEPEKIYIDGDKDSKYPSTPMTVSRTEISQDVYVYLGEEGVYVYQLITDTTAITPLKTASQLYIAVGNKLTNANSFGIYCYFDETTENPFRTYKYNETSGAFGRNFAGAYPDYCGLKVLETGNGYTKYAYEMFIEYSLLGLDSAPESVKIFAVARINTGGAIANGNVTKDLPITDITKYQEFNNNGLVTDTPEDEEDSNKIEIDGIKDDVYSTILPIIGKRSDPVVTQEVYVYLGEDGIYVYQLVTDNSGKTEKAHVEYYFTLGGTDFLDKMLSVHLYYESTPYIRSYIYSSTNSNNLSRKDALASQYCQYSIKHISDVDGLATYAYELFVDYSYFGLTEAPESIKAQIRAQSGSGSPLTNSVVAGTLPFTNIDNYNTFDENGYVYTNISVRDLELDPSDIVSNNYEREFTIQTLNVLNKLPNVTFTGVGSEYITEIGNGRYKISIPADKIALFAEAQKINIIAGRNVNASFTVKVLTEVPTSYKLLMIGNSFSDDTIQWVYEICDDLEIEITIANLYIGGATLDRHLANLLNDVNEYVYVEYDKFTNTWIRNENISIAEALTFEKWNFVSLQQGSAKSGQADSYNDMNSIMDEISKLKADVKFIWNMTWAYQQDSTHSSFVNYENNQETMYNAIVNAVQTKVLTNERIQLISPAGTAIQNARTSFVGDTLTRDGHHLSYDLGRYIAGLTMVGTLTGADLTQVKYSPNLEDKYRDMAIESAINAINNPYTVTQSTYVE